jgi:hypothetical protein
LAVPEPEAGQLPATRHGIASAEPVRARDVQVDKLFRARCRRDGCGWTGGEHAAYQEANAEREAHLKQHTLVGEDGR